MYHVYATYMPREFYPDVCCDVRLLKISVDSDKFSPNSDKFSPNFRDCPRVCDVLCDQGYPDVR